MIAKKKKRVIQSKAQKKKVVNKILFTFFYSCLVEKVFYEGEIFEFENHVLELAVCLLSQYLNFKTNYRRNPKSGNDFISYKDETWNFLVRSGNLKVGEVKEGFGY